MSLESLRARVESGQTSALLSVASGWSTFEKLLLESAPLAHVVEWLPKSYGNSGKLANVIRALAEQQVDPRYENPNDIALSIYLRALMVVSRPAAEIAAAIVLRAPNIWWARMVAIHSLEDRPLTTAPSLATESSWDVLFDVGESFVTLSSAIDTSLAFNFLTTGEDINLWNQFTSVALTPFESSIFQVGSERITITSSSSARTQPSEWETTAAA